MSCLTNPTMMSTNPNFKAGLLSIITALSLPFLTTQQAAASSYQQVYDVVFNNSLNPETDTDNQQAKQERAVYQSGQLPKYQVTASKFNKAVREQLATRTEQTLNQDVDYYDRLDKLVHSNGICMAGTWEMTEDVKNSDGQSYTGMFAKEAKSLFIGRLSVALSDTKQGEYQAFGMAGKIFGTDKANANVTTENFFVAEVLTGAKRDSVYDAPMTNNPKVGFRFNVISLGLKIGPIFRKADKEATMRPVDGIAAMGINADNKANGNKGKAGVVSPKYMMIAPVKPVNYVITPGIDFRNEFALTPEEKAKGITRDFEVYVSDTANKPEDSGWQHIGHIKADKTAVSYGCDRQLHFAHPKAS